MAGVSIVDEPFYVLSIFVLLQLGCVGLETNYFLESLKLFCTAFDLVDLKNVPKS